MKIHHGLFPLQLYEGWRFSDDTAWSTIHRAYVRRFWQERGLLERLRAVATSLSWPLTSAMLIVWLTLRNGPPVKRRLGKSLWRQALEQVDVLVRCSIAPFWYYSYELYHDDRRRVADRYILRHETKSGVFNYLKKFYGGSSRPLGDKLLFQRTCAENGLPSIPVLRVLERGSVQWSEGDPKRLPARDLFVKRRYGRGGKGAESWTFEGDGRYRSRRGEQRDEAALARHLLERSREEDLLVQPRLENHPALRELSAGALVTLRVVTVLDETGDPEATHAVLRMAISPESAVDNFHAGGIAAPLDLVSGRLGAASGGGVQGMGMFPDVGWCDTHPLTGARIVGRELSGWREAVALAERAHRCFAGLVAVGWDVALTPSGPVLVEGNSGPDVDILQRTHGAPLGDSRFGQLLAFHLRRALGESRPLEVASG